MPAVYRTIRETVERFPGEPVPSPAWQLTPGEDPAIECEGLRELWTDLAERHWDDPAVLRNAHATARLEDPVLERKLLDRLAELEPKTPMWPTALAGHLFELARTDPDPELLLSDAIAYLDRAVGLGAKFTLQFCCLQAKVRLGRGDDLGASEWAARATEGVTDRPGYADADFEHLAWNILGLLALRRSDDAGAIEALTQCRQIINAAADVVFPTLDLAAEMVVAGLTDPVVEYLGVVEHHCAVVCPRARSWRAALMSGQQVELPRALVAPRD